MSVNFNNLPGGQPGNKQIGSDKKAEQHTQVRQQTTQQAVVQHRKNQLTNTDITWTSYNDCPFFPKRLGLEYRALTGTGWYSKMYQIMVAIAGRAVERQYPITTKQIADLIREFDNDTGRWYENRPLEVEADRALEYVYKNQ